MYALLRWAEIAARYPGQLEERDRIGPSYKGHGGESVSEVAERMAAFWMRLRREEAPVCVVTHRRDTPAHELTRRWLERLSRMIPLRILLLEEGAAGARLLDLEGRLTAPSNIGKELSRG